MPNPIKRKYLSGNWRLSENCTMANTAKGRDIAPSPLTRVLVPFAIWTTLKKNRAAKKMGGTTFRNLKANLIR
jgi:hypothetical protein